MAAGGAATGGAHRGARRRGVVRARPVGAEPERPRRTALGRFLLVPMLPVLLLHLAAAALDMDRRRGARVAIAGAYAASLAVAIAFAAAYDAFWDATPADPAFASPFLVSTGFGVPRLLRWAAAVTQIGVGAVALGLAVDWARRRLARATAASAGRGRAGGCGRGRGDRRAPAHRVAAAGSVSAGVDRGGRWWASSSR